MIKFILFFLKVKKYIKSWDINQNIEIIRFKLNIPEFK